MQKRTDNFTRKGKYKTANNCQCALKHFKKFCIEAGFPAQSLTVGMMMDFQDYLAQKGLKLNTISLYTHMLRAAYNHAVDENLIAVDNHPFRKAFTGKEKTRKRALPLKTVKQLIDIRLDNRALDFARAIFLFSIYMQGMAFVDIAHLKKSQMRNGHIEYQRHKTHQTLHIRIEPHAQAILDKYKEETQDSPYLFPILDGKQADSWLQYESALRNYNKRLRKISQKMGLDEPLTSYVSRHTWASLARQCGVSDTIICEAMGHNNIATTTIYLAALDTNLIASANRKLIDTLTR